MNFRQGTLVQTLASAGVLALFSGCGDDGKAESETAVISDTETSTGPTAGSTEPTSGTTTGETTEAPTTSSSTTDDTGTSTTGPIIPPAYDQWLTIPLEGAVCGNNSQYKIFVNFHEGAKDLLVMLEPGGALPEQVSKSARRRSARPTPTGSPTTCSTTR
jgi:hypothetical protein